MGAARVVLLCALKGLGMVVFEDGGDPPWEGMGSLKLTRMEKVELALIPCAGLAVWLIAPRPSLELPLGNVAGYGAAVLLGQGLARDLVRLALRRRARREPLRRIPCLCAESTLGLLLVAVAVGLSLAGVRAAIALARFDLAGGLTALLLFGFLAKDYVIVVRREKDHASVAVW